MIQAYVLISLSAAPAPWGAGAKVHTEFMIYFSCAAGVILTALALATALSDMISFKAYLIISSERQVDKVKDAGSDLKDKIMGSEDSSGSAGEALDSARSSVSDAPATVKQKTRGNPLAAGLVAFGLGALIAGLIPVSDRNKKWRRT